MKLLCPCLVILFGGVTHLQHPWISNGEKLSGHLQMVAEDHFDQKEYYKYGLLNEETVIEINDTYLSTIHGEAWVEVEGSLQTPISTRGADVFKSQSFAVNSLKVLKTGNTSNSLKHTRLKRDTEVDVQGPRSILMVQIKYNGQSSASYCDELCMEDGMWGTSGELNVNGAFQAATEGSISFPRNLGEIHVVDLSGSLDSSSNCEYAPLSVAADEALVQQGVDVSSFMHKAYYIPSSFSACTFGGTAYLACRPYDCKVWVRQRYATNLAHELGHNLGMHHSATDLNDDGRTDNEYGDNSCLMGASARWRGFSAAHRLQRGWLQNNEVEQIGSINPTTNIAVNIRALYGSDTFAMPAAVRIPRSAGGAYVISLRGSGAYDASIPSAYQNTITVHRIPAEPEDPRQSVEERSFLIEVLQIGDWTTLQGDIVIQVVSLNSDSASIQIHGISPGTVYVPDPPNLDSNAVSSCTTLGWSLRDSPNGEVVCGQSVLGGKCYKEVSLHTAAAVCRSEGARLCTPQELLSDVTQGTGCNLDNKYIWTSAECSGGALVSLGRTPTSSSQELQFPTVCHEADTKIASVRCCSDAVISTTSTTTTVVRREHDSFCNTQNNLCVLLAKRGQCTSLDPTQAQYMALNCRVACGRCAPRETSTSQPTSVPIASTTTDQPSTTPEELTTPTTTLTTTPDTHRDYVHVHVADLSGDFSIFNSQTFEENDGTSKASDGSSTSVESTITIVGGCLIIVAALAVIITVRRKYGRQHVPPVVQLEHSPSSLNVSPHASRSSANPSGPVRMWYTPSPSRTDIHQEGEGSGSPNVYMSMDHRKYENQARSQHLLVPRSSSVASYIVNPNPYGQDGIHSSPSIQSETHEHIYYKASSGGPRYNPISPQYALASAGSTGADYRHIHGRETPC